MLKWVISITLIIILLIFLIYKNESKFSSCIYDPKTNISYVYVDTKNIIKNIQDSLNKQDNVYYINNGTLYYNNKLIKKLLGCSKEHIQFMNKKYNVQLLS